MNTTLDELAKMGIHDARMNYAQHAGAFAYAAGNQRIAAGQPSTEGLFCPECETAVTLCDDGSVSCSCFTMLFERHRTANPMGHGCRHHHRDASIRARMNTAEAARAMNAARKTKGAGSGRPIKPAYCRTCGLRCESTRAAVVHCRQVVYGYSRSDDMYAVAWKGNGVWNETECQGLRYSPVDFEDIPEEDRERVEALELAMRGCPFEEPVE